MVSEILHKHRSIEAQATACVRRGISQKISVAFGNRDIQLRLTGGTAERYAVPLSSNWISIEGDLEDNHALISDFDFMLQLDQIGSSYAAGKDDLTIDTYGCQIGYAKLRINNNQSVQGVFRASDHENYLSARTLKKKEYNKPLVTQICRFTQVLFLTLVYYALKIPKTILFS